jgi:uncharacterized protein (DUF3084 family)
MKEELETMEKELTDLEVEHKAAADLFEKQKEEAMATMKKQEELKKDLSKLAGKTKYKRNFKLGGDKSFADDLIRIQVL